MDRIQYSNLSAGRVICLLLVMWTLCFFSALTAWADGGEKEKYLQVPDSLTDLFISGDNTLRFEEYSTSGDESSSLYQFEGPQTYNQFSLNFNKRDNPYTTWSGRSYGVINDSDYRAIDRGFVPERMNLTYEKGDFVVPFRIEVGDYFHYYSHRTIQRSLKGIQLELQPDIGSNAGRRLSIQFATGAKQSRWKNFDLNEDLTNSSSLLFEDRLFGVWNLNFVHNYRKSLPGDTTPGRSQYVVGLAMEKSVTVGNQDITFEGEFDHFDGDHDGVDGASGRGRNDNGIFMQLSGKSKLPFTYRLRFEDYGQDYRPNGAVVPPDRHTDALDLGWRFDSGLRLRGRFQHFRDRVETVDPVDTNTMGIILSGPMFKGVVNGLNGNINAYIQDVESRNKITNTTTPTINARFSKPIYAGWNAQADIFYQFVNNQNAGTHDTTTRQVRLSGDHAVDLFGFAGHVTPGILIRQVDNITSGVDDVYPTFAFNAKRGPHSFNYNMGYRVRDARLLSNVDVSTLSQNISYRYTTENNTFGLEINSADRNPDPGRSSKSFRAAVFWTHKIGRRVNLRRAARRLGVGAGSRPQSVEMAAQVYPSSSNGAMVDMAELTPGAGMKTIRERLARAGITGAYERNNLIVYEAILLDEVDQRQRLALVHKDGTLQKAALIIELDDVGNVDSVMQTFERVRKELLDRYGNPSNFYEKGDFSTDLADNVNGSAFIRMMEWTMPGGIIRYGIPRRLDRQIRMEIQFANSFPPENDTLWSIERVR